VRLWLTRHEDAFFGLMLAVSLSFHAALAAVGLERAGGPPDPLVVIDLTQTIQTPRVAPVAPRPAAPPAPPPEKEWNLPKPGENPPPPVPEAPAPEPAPVPENAPIGNFKLLSRLPQVLNAAELKLNLNRFYPTAERERGAEGKVVLDMVINEKGQVISVVVVEATTPAFGEAAQQAARLLRYSPAQMGKDPVSVKLRQAFTFKISNCPGGCINER